MTMPSQTSQPASPPQEQADRLAYFVASNPTPGTGLATIAALVALSDTSPFIQINTGSKGVYLDYLILTNTAPGTAGASIRCAVKTDLLKAAPTGGTLLTPACSRRLTSTAGVPVAAATPLCSIWAGALVAAAAVTPILHCSRLIRPVIPVINDMYVIKFGASDYGVSSLVSNGTLNSDRYIPFPPVIVDPNMTGQVHIWLPSQSGASSYEIELGFAEF
jgi:hypothetical protein